MHEIRFDALTRSLASPAPRRATLRLLAAGMLGAWLSQRGVAPMRAAQRSDRDGDGLYDDDETDIYGTDPDFSDSDGDGYDDGLEIYNRDHGQGPSDPLTSDVVPTPPPPCPAGQTFCIRAGCVDLTSDPFHCGDCDIFCDNIIGPICVNRVCTGEPNPPPAPTCRTQGARCDSDGQCCNGSGAIRCCFNGTVLDTVCTDTAPTGFVCPGDPPPPGQLTCPAGQTDCGGSCVDTSTQAAHCGACFQSCPLGGICRNSVCVAG